MTPRLLASCAQSQIWIARYGLDFDGWETYFYTSGANEYLTLRHHHSSLPDDRDGCYSNDWAISTWWFIGITRSGLYPRMYRNGMQVDVTYGDDGMRDPDTSNRKLLHGCRFTEDSDWFGGPMWGTRIWGRELSDYEMDFLFQRERELFGV